MYKIRPLLDHMKQILLEIKSAHDNYVNVFNQIKKIYYSYQNSEIDFKLYKLLKNKILRGKTEEEVKEAYDIYINSLKIKLLELNSKIFKLIYTDNSYDSLFLGKIKKKSKKLNLPNLESLEISEIEEPLDIEIKKIEKLDQEKIKKPEIDLYKELKEQIDLVKKQEFKDKAIDKKEEKLIQVKKKNFFERLSYAFNAKSKPWLDDTQKNIFLDGILTFDFIKYLFFGVEKGKELFGETQILPSILTYQDKTKDISFLKRESLDPFLLEKEIKELKKLISKKNPEIYKPNTLGYIANMTVRKISIYFIEKYPDFFKKIYQGVRFANLKLLANTYINIMFFLSFFGFLISIPIFTYIFALQAENIFLVFLKSIGSSFLFGNIIFWLSYYYPFMKAKERKRSINTNMPFAIDHMSSVIASGVSPSTMFRLISSSNEYGEISIEFEKVSNYVDFFGYDILTAIRAVALSTPSEEFKEFLDGFVSTIETGGDIKQYLQQKSSESLLNYRLERQKYVESLSTYSDIYTGVLIAAPLFFVTTLSLISIMGGKIAGFRVDTLIAIGTYLVIPLLNVIFIIFLELNQPEI